MPKKVIFMNGLRKPNLGRGRGIAFKPKPAGLMNSIQRYNLVYRAPSWPKKSTDVYNDKSTLVPKVSNTEKKSIPDSFHLKQGESLKGRGNIPQQEGEEDKIIEERLEHPRIATSLLYDSDEETPLERKKEENNADKTNRGNNPEKTITERKSIPTNTERQSVPNKAGPSDTQSGEPQEGQGEGLVGAGKGKGKGKGESGKKRSRVGNYSKMGFSIK